MFLHEKTVAVVVIGVNGSGKTAFINVASGSNTPVSKPLGSRTPELKSSTLSLDGRTITLIDTPGFGEPTPSVLEVLKLISDHFSELQGIKLGGVIFMHCLTEDRMRNRSRHNFHTFSKFCGDESLRDVIIVTNKESADKASFFELVDDEGTRVLCYDGSQSSAHGILRRFLRLEDMVPPACGNLSCQQAGSSDTTTRAEAACELTGQIEHCTKTLIPSHSQNIDAEMLSEPNNSLEKKEYIRHDLEQTVTNITTENSRLQGENRRYKNDFVAQRAEAELRIRLLGEERRAREVAEAGRERAEAQLAEERALWERQKMERESHGELARLSYEQLFAGGALVLLVLCVSRFAFHPLS